MKIEIIIGRNIRHHRRLLGMSQQALGKYLGITFQQLQKYESGVNEISCKKMHRLAELFECSIDSLCLPECGPPEAPIQTPHSNSRIYFLISYFNRIPSPAVRDKVCNLVQTLAELPSSQQEVP